MITHKELIDMTREEAVTIIFQLINAAILDTDLEDELAEVAQCIEDDSFEEE